MKKDNHKKNLYIKTTIFTALFIVSLVHVFILFRFLCDNAAIGLSWSISISFLICGLVLWIIKPDDKIPKKRMMYLLALRIIYTSLGSILFIVNAFVFINEIIISCLLVITVALIYISICLFTQLLKSKNRDVFLSGYIKTDNENIDEDLDLKEENEFYKK